MFATVDRDAYDAAARAYVEMMKLGVGPGGVPSTSQFVRDKADISALAGQFRSVTKQMSLSFRNESAGAITGQFSMTAYANGSDIAAPVPEPGAIALGLAGLSMVGVRLRRRCADPSASV
ncbi:MAG: PEP-CTERM sorting domain-containing protein [Aquabacterium sp.]